jgi:hypothetical protein
MNNQRSKLGNIPCEFEGIRFDSKWELAVYQAIRKHFSKDEIRVHQKILVKPKTTHYKEKFWKCDFAVGDADFTGKFLLIEAKGFPTADFKRQLQLLDSYNPNLLDKIRIVQGVSTKVDECFTSITLSELHAELSELHIELEKQKALLGNHFILKR